MIGESTTREKGKNPSRSLSQRRGRNEQVYFLFIEQFSTMIDVLSGNASARLISNRTTNQIDSIKTIIPENYQIILLSFAYGIISLLSVLGNSSIIYIVIHNRRMHSVTNYFICNLALADCLVACFAVPFQVRRSESIHSRISSGFCFTDLVSSCCITEMDFTAFSL